MGHGLGPQGLPSCSMKSQMVALSSQEDNHLNYFGAPIIVPGGHIHPGGSAWHPCPREICTTPQLSVFQGAMTRDALRDCCFVITLASLSCVLFFALHRQPLSIV